MSDSVPQCVFWDLDGTLLDSLPGIEFSVREAFVNCDIPLPIKSLRDLIGPPIRVILARAGNVREASTLDALEREFRASYDSEGWRQTVCFPDARRVLQMMRDAGHRLFVVSNKPRNISLRILEEERILEYFEEVITRDTRSPVYAGKKEMLATILEARSIERKSCVMVGDTVDDANAAASLGIDFIWMTYGYGSPLEISSFPVARSLEKLSEFLPLITKEPVCD